MSKRQTCICACCWASQWAIDFGNAAYLSHAFMMNGPRLQQKVTTKQHQTTTWRFCNFIKSPYGFFMIKTKHTCASLMGSFLLPNTLELFQSPFQLLNSTLAFSVCTEAYWHVWCDVCIWSVRKQRLFLQNTVLMSVSFNFKKSIFLYFNREVYRWILLLCAFLNTTFTPPTFYEILFETAPAAHFWCDQAQRSTWAQPKIERRLVVKAAI